MKIAIYARVSTSKQDLDGQINDLKQYLTAVYQGCEIVGIYTEKVSGTLDETDREQFNQLLQLTKNDVDYIAVWELSRLYRKTLQLLETLEYLHSKGIGVIERRNNLISLNPDGKKNPMASIVINVLAQMAEIERESIIERSKRNTIDRLQSDTLAHTSRPPFGYCKVNKMLEVDPNTSKQVVEVFTLAAEGYSYTQIAASTGINKATIHHILHNEAYIGIGRNKLVEGKEFATPRIISDELYYKVQKELEGRRNREYKPTATNRPLWKKVVCPNCGSHLTYTSGGKYSCHKCRKVTIGADMLMVAANMALNAIYAESSVKETIDRLTNNINELDRALSVISQQIDEALAQKNEQTKLVELLAAHSKDIDVKPHVRKLEKINERLNRLNTQYRQTRNERDNHINTLNEYRPTDANGLYVADAWNDENAIRKHVEKVFIVKHEARRNWVIANVKVFGRIIGVAFDCKTKRYNVDDCELRFNGEDIEKVNDNGDVIESIAWAVYVGKSPIDQYTKVIIG